MAGGAYGPDTEELLRRIAACKDKWYEFGKSTTLNVSFLQIRSLPPLPRYLEFLICYETPLEELPDLPEGLLTLQCDMTQLRRLPKLPVCLKTLICSNIRTLQELPALPQGLEVLECCLTGIGELPPLPSSLKTLYCNFTQITDLPDLPKV